MAANSPLFLLLEPVIVQNENSSPIHANADSHMSEPNAIFDRLTQTLSKVVVGQSTLVQQMLVALLSGGHVIVEGVPGTGKTLLVKVLARLIQSDFRRIQLTPDICPPTFWGRTFLT